MSLPLSDEVQHEALNRAMQERALLASALAEIAYDYHHDAHAIYALAVLREVFGDA